ncbi:hypothetical protein CRU87_02885 [Aliarcobacter trophiarum LMG 25534]|uniref:Periplasmic protein n=1 Tax=Aliarcobacter trophiarum LMG 25534 TaxID=1032241 RepID=A0AAD0VL76_9BACT|nr:hypothetical protein [Aliarcobacter trophiarum]AXK47957.1 hypothetical protein ATR_0063 [Aliarcobacter trophiarum LMG 25534]RXI28164.1 hypothetical protein CRU89_02970 [Aliarcobacter trophiarum]RXJ92382.1 hypothetical protein CRU87_02885 [Aliarcobacter trophiarum LMG 25534]
MKKLLLIIFLCLSLNANINQAVIGLIGSSDFNTHRNLISSIFKNQSYFYTNGSLDYAKISQTLQNNNLLKLNLGSTQSIEATFIFTSSPKKSFKNINDILKTIGVQNFVTLEQSVVDNQLKWSIKVQTAAAINPLRLSQELQSTNCRIIDIKKEGNNKWSYYIDSKKSSIYKAEDLVTKASVSLKKPIRPYILEIANSDSLKIDSNIGNSWYPTIIFYDDSFNVIDVFESETLHKNLRVDIPTNTRFVKVDDFYALTNIKNGLIITKE